MYEQNSIIIMHMQMKGNDPPLSVTHRMSGMGKMGVPACWTHSTQSKAEKHYT